MNEHNSVKPFRIVDLYECLVSSQSDSYSLVSAARSAQEQAAFDPDLAANVAALITKSGADDDIRTALIERIKAYDLVYRYRGRAVDDVWTVYRFDLTTGEEQWCATVDTEAWADLMVSIGNGEQLAPAA